MRHTVHTLVRIGAAVILKPERRDILLDQFDLLQSEIARLHELETRFEDAQKRDELVRVHESISNLASVIKADIRMKYSQPGRKKIRFRFVRIAKGVDTASLQL
jgi:hypothetical protein